MTRTHAPGPQRIDMAEARRVIEVTARNNRTGLIGSPHGGGRPSYNRTDAIRLLGRADIAETDTYLGQQVLRFRIVGLGWHTLYLNLAEPKEDPWA